MIEIIEWDIHRELGPGYDPVIIHGDFVGHPSVTRGQPGAFKSFDKDTGIGVSVRGNIYHFERISFKPNGFARTYEEAMEWISKNWVK